MGRIKANFPYIFLCCAILVGLAYHALQPPLRGVGLGDASLNAYSLADERTHTIHLSESVVVDIY